MKVIIKPLYQIILTSILFTSIANSAGVNDRNTDLVPTGKGHGEARLPSLTNSDNGTPDNSFSLDDSEESNQNSGAITSSVSTKGLSPTGYGINYHGGPVIKGATNIYYIWYGDWSNNTAQAILTNLAMNIGGSSRYNINTTYSDNSGYVVNSVVYKSSTSVDYPYGKALSDRQIQSVVNTAIVSGSLPSDSNGVYFVLTSKDVTATSGFGTQYCGWHTHTKIANTDIKYAFVGDPTIKAPAGCEAQSISPNSNAGADGMASVIVHELEESVTDPDLNAWYDRSGQENSDKCAWTFGTTTVLPNGAKYNVSLGAYKYLIQQNWVNAAPSGVCKMAY